MLATTAPGERDRPSLGGVPPGRELTGRLGLREAPPMRSGLVVTPRIPAGARIACTSAVATLAVAAGLLVPVQAHAAGTGVLPGRYENTSSSITYTGTWSTVSSTSDSGGSYGNLNVDGSAAITFSGTGATWYSRVNNFSGTADVSVDGVKKATVDLYSATSKTKQNVYSVSDL